MVQGAQQRENVPWTARQLRSTRVVAWCPTALVMVIAERIMPYTRTLRGDESPRSVAYRAWRTQMEPDLTYMMHLRGGTIPEGYLYMTVSARHDKRADAGNLGKGLEDAMVKSKLLPDDHHSDGGLNFRRKVPSSEQERTVAWVWWGDDKYQEMTATVAMWAEGLRDATRIEDFVEL